jgi:hypothetical protein
VSVAVRRPLLLLAAVVALAGAFLLVRQVRRPPPWWAPPPSVGEVGEFAAAVEHALAASFTRVREPGERWSLRVEEAELNAWLAERLPLWAESGFLGEGLEWPGSLGLVQVRLSPRRLEVAIELRDLGTIACLSAVPVESAEGWILRWHSAGLGRLQAPLGAAALRSSLGRRFGGEGDRAWLGSLLGEGAELPSRLTLADGREVRLVGGEIGEGELRLELVSGEGPPLPR